MIERTYVIPLRKGTMLAPRTRRAKKAIFVLREFLVRHMKVDNNNIHISQGLNEHIWQNGMRNPIMRIKTVVTKDDKGLVLARLFGEPMPVKDEKKKDGKDAKKDSKKEEAPKAAAPQKKEAAASEEKKPENKESAPLAQAEKKENASAEKKPSKPRAKKSDEKKE